MNIKSALQLKPVKVSVNIGEEVYEATLRRPSLADLMDALKVSEQKEINFAAWLVWKHLMEGDRIGMAFDHLEDVMRCDANMVLQLAGEIEKLYNEGSK